MQSPAQTTISSRTPTTPPPPVLSVQPVTGDRSIRRTPCSQIDGRGASAHRPDSRGQGEEERRPAAFTRDAHAPAGTLHELLHDREPDPGAAALAVARLLDAIEALPDPWQVLRRDPRAGVGHPDVEPVGCAYRADLNAAALGGVADGVLEQ